MKKHEIKIDPSEIKNIKEQIMNNSIVRILNINEFQKTQNLPKLMQEKNRNDPLTIKDIESWIKKINKLKPTNKIQPATKNTLNPLVIFDEFYQSLKRNTSV